MLAVVMFINRSGSMVIPFLSVYLTESLGFTLKQAGFILSLFGFGSMGGSFLGGWLTDRIGHFRVQFWSLVLGGSFFLVLAQLKTFTAFAMGIFILSLISECLRPANSSSVSFYARPENITRAFSLNRMAINLGFAIGPALAGLLATISYRLLFLADGFTCIAAGLFFFYYFRSLPGSRKKEAVSAVTLPKVRSPYRDFKFILFVLLSTLFACVFFQFFSTLPLYYRQVRGLTEAQIGMLLGVNGLVVFSLEMLAVYLLGKRFRPASLIAFGALLVALSLVILNFVQGNWIVLVSMVILSIAEIFSLPFMATIPVKRSAEINRGTYMGLYNISFSSSFILGPFIGTTIIDLYGFDTLWWSSGLLVLITGAGFYLLIQKL